MHEKGKNSKGKPSLWLEILRYFVLGIAAAIVFSGVMWAIDELAPRFWDW